MCISSRFPFSFFFFSFFSPRNYFPSSKQTTIRFGTQIRYPSPFMDNYFSKFLCNHPKASSKYQKYGEDVEMPTNAKEVHHEVSPASGVVTGAPLPAREALDFHDRTTHPTSNLSLFPDAGGRGGVRIPSFISFHRSSPFSEDELLWEERKSPAPPPRDGRDARSFSCEEELPWPRSAWKKGREGTQGSEERHGPTPQRRRVEPSPSSSAPTSSLAPPREERSLSKGEDDEEDLFLLLGSQEARRQIEKEKTVERSGKKVPPVFSSSSSFPVSSAPLRPRRMRDLPWNGSRTVLRSITRCFGLQLEVELTRNPTLFEAFSPFLKKRLLDKVERSRREHSAVSPASGTSPSPLSWFSHPMDLPEDSWVNGTEAFLSNPYREVIASQSILEPPPETLTPELVNPPCSTSPFPSQTMLNKDGEEENKQTMEEPSSSTPQRTSVPRNGTGTNFTLRPYQIEGVQYLLNHFHRGLSCVLSDDMGLGKTAQVASFLHVLWGIHRIPGPHLIICPMSTITNWVRELNRWTPELKVMKYHGNRKDRTRQKFFSEEEGGGVWHHRHLGIVVTTPAIFNQDKGFFLHRPWVVVAVDEAHVLKNSNTRITGLSRKLTACFRLAVTGTPIQNNIQEVFSILGFLFPSITVMEGNFEDDDPATAVTACAQILSHLMLRRTKGQLLLGLPPRIDHPVTMLEPTFVQHELLRLMSTGALEEDRDALLQGHLTHQRMVCSHPLSLKVVAKGSSGSSGPQDVDLYPSCTSEKSLDGAHGVSSTEGRGGGVGDGALFSSSYSIVRRLTSAGIPFREETIIHCSAKMRYLDRELPRLQAEGHRCLIFTNFASVLDLLEGFCVLRGYSYERLDGGCSRVERELSLLRFNNASSSCFLFLITTSAGGVGVTLTGADTVILFDANFNPQLDRQAADRAHRIGQTREVHVYRLCLANTLEEYIREVSEYKASLGDMIVVHASGRGNRTGGESSTENQVDGTTTTTITSPTTSLDGTIPLTSPTFSGTSVGSSSASLVGNGSFTLSGQEIRKFLEAHQQRSRKRFEEGAVGVLGTSRGLPLEEAEEDEVVVVEPNERKEGVARKDEEHCVALTCTTAPSFSSRPGDPRRPTPSSTPQVGTVEADHPMAGRAAERKLVVELLSLERGNDKEGVSYGSSRRAAEDGGGGGALFPSLQTHICFVCGERMYKMEPLYHCATCPKAYHAECVGEPKPKPGYGVSQRHWTCPRHRCFTCDKVAVSSDGAIFMCYSCPRAYCFDCLPVFFLELDDRGEELRYVHRTYDKMEEEGVTERKSCYYLQCLYCAGMEDSSSSSSASSTISSGSDEEEVIE